MSIEKIVDIFYQLPPPEEWDALLSHSWSLELSILIEKICYAVSCRLFDLSDDVFENTIYSLLKDACIPDFAQCSDVDLSEPIIESGEAYARNIPYWNCEGIFSLFSILYKDWRIYQACPLSDEIPHEGEATLDELKSLINSADDSSIATWFCIPQDLISTSFIKEFKNNITDDAVCVPFFLIISEESYSQYLLWREKMSTPFGNKKIASLISLMDDVYSVLSSAFFYLDYDTYYVNDNVYFVYAFGSEDYNSYNGIWENLYASLNPRMLLIPTIIQYCISALNAEYHFLDKAI